MIRHIVAALALICAPTMAQADPFLEAIAAAKAAAEQRARDNAKVRTLVAGDSISAAVDTTDLCGKTINVSIGGYSVIETRAMLEYAIPLVKPDVVVLNVGTNGYPEQFWALYDSTVQWLLGQGVKVVFMGVAYRPEWDFGFGVRAWIQSMPFVPAQPLNSIYTVDSVGHLSEAGKSKWFDDVRAACLPLVTP